MRRFGWKAGVAGAALLTLGTALLGRAADAAGGGGTTPVLVKSSVALTPDVLASLGGRTAHVSAAWPEIRWFAAAVTSAQRADLAGDSRVALVEDDRRTSVPDGAAHALGKRMARAASSAAQPASSSPLVPWNLDMADTRGSGYDGTGVTVAVVDSGLPQNWSEFLSTANVDTEHAVGFGAEGWGSESATLKPIRGTGGYLGQFAHGLSVSAVVVGFESEFGRIAGAAPGAKVLPVRVIDQFNWGWTSWFAAGILYVADLKTGGALPGPVVINFSIHADTDPILTDAVRYAIGHGVLFVTIAGNDGPAAGSITHPGRMPEAITVGMVGWVEEASFDPADWIFRDVPENDAAQVYVPGISGREADPPASPTLIDVLAPGSGIYAPNPMGAGYSEGREVAYDAFGNFPLVGTSLAAPHVAGIVAQMLQKNPALTQAQAESILRATALFVAPDADGVVTPIFVADTPFGPGAMYWGPWGANATGAGLARGAAAVAATPK
jgi:subtilisin family serine protease